MAVPTLFKPEALEKLRFWVIEREGIRNLKAANHPKPWTDNPVLRTTRFCNVRRMDDKVSVWLLDCWYPNNSPKNLMLVAAGLARLINWPDALDGLRGQRSGVFNKYDPDVVRAHLDGLAAAGAKVFTGAYIINGQKGISKVETVCNQVRILYENPDLLRPESMQRTHAQLMRVKGIGSFMAGQMVADLRHVWQPVGKKDLWQDRYTWAPLGPGSHRGMSWLLGWDGVEQLKRMSQEVFESYLRVLIDWFRADLAHVWQDRKLEAHDVQNCLCEFDKFMRLTNGTGRAKNQYAGV